MRRLLYIAHRVRHSPPQWLHCMLHVLRNPEASRALGQAARRWVPAEDARAARVASLVDICRQVTEEADPEAFRRGGPTASPPPAACVAAVKPKGGPSGDRPS
jgi:hypothetical protein